MASLVSFVITSYNQLKYVDYSIRSCLSQTLSPLEIIFVDDGSVDGTSDYIDVRYGSSVRLITQGNSGPSACINAGLLAARGEYIALLGADDVNSSTRLENQLFELQHRGLDILFSTPLLIDAVGDLLDDKIEPVFYGKTGQVSFKFLVESGNYLCGPSAFMRRNVIDHIGLFRNGLLHLQDYEYWLRAIVSGLSLALSDSRQVYYRRHSSSLSRRAKSLASSAEMAIVVNWIIDDPRSTPFLRNWFSELLVPSVSSLKPLSLFEKTIFLFSHGNDLVRASAFNRAVELLEDPNEKASLSAKGLDLVQFLLSTALS